MFPSSFAFLLKTLVRIQLSCYPAPFLRIFHLPNRLFRFLSACNLFSVSVFFLLMRLVLHLPGATLVEIKKSFRNVGNVLYDWAGDDYCSWRGVLCDNVTFAVAAL